MSTKTQSELSKFFGPVVATGAERICVRNLNNEFSCFKISKKIHSKETRREIKYFKFLKNGTSTHHNDLFETRAIKLAFGNHAYDMKVNSTKSMVGHLLGAAGAIEFVTCVKEIQDSFVHATVGYTTPDEELDLDYCKEAVQMDVPYALSNSLGFGGHNASILLKKYSE